MSKNPSQSSNQSLPTPLVNLADPSQANSPLALPTSGLGRRKLLKGLGYSLAGLSASLSLNASLAASDTPTATSVSGTSVGSPDPHFNPNAQPKAGISGPITLTQTFAGYDFRPVVSSSTYSFQFTGGIYWLGGGDPSFWYRLLLPQGSKVTDVTFYVTDNDASSNNVQAGLYVLDPVMHTINSLVSLTSTGAYTSPQTLSQTGTPAAPLATIDNASYSYQLLFTSKVGNANHILWGAQISYTNIIGRFQAV